MNDMDLSLSRLISQAKDNVPWRTDNRELPKIGQVEISGYQCSGFRMTDVGQDVIRRASQPLLANGHRVMTSRIQYVGALMSQILVDLELHEAGSGNAKISSCASHAA